jgi:integrase
MRGSIQRRGNLTWRISIELDRDPVTGRRRRRSETFHGTKRDAEARLAQLIHEHETGLAVDPSRTTVAEWLRQWLAQRAPQLRPTTLERYRASVEGRLVPAFGRLQLQQLRPAHVQAAYGRWLAEGLAPATVASHHRILGRALNDAVRLQLVGRAVTQAVEVPSAPPRQLAADASIIARVLEAVNAEPQPWRAAGLLIVHTGMRRGELCGLQWSDLDLDRGTAAIRRTRTTTYRGQVVEGPTKTRAGARLIPVAPPAVEALRDWRRLQLEQRLAAGAGWQGGDWVVTLDGLPVRPDVVTHWWTRTARRAGVSLRLHDLRHLAATLMAQHGAPPRVIAEVLGHTRASFTLDVYAGAPDLEAMRAATETLARALERARRGG